MEWHCGPAPARPPPCRGQGRVDGATGGAAGSLRCRSVARNHPAAGVPAALSARHRPAARRGHVELPRRWAAAQAEMGGYGARRIEIGRPWASAHRKRHRGEGEGAGECTGGPSRREGVPAGRGRPHGEFARVEGQPGSLPAGQGDRQLARAAARCRAGLGRRRRRGAHCVTGGRSLESR